MLPVPLSSRLASAILLLARLRSLPLSHTLGCLLALPLHGPFLGPNHEALNNEIRRYEIMPAVDILNEPFRPHCSGDFSI